MSTIKRIKISNFLGIEELEVAPGKINLISGGNRQGKTSLLEAIEKAVTNRERRPRVIRDGADQAIILIDLEDGTTIRRSITPKTSTLAVTKDGFKANAPQAFLSGLIGSYAFNPVDFINEDEKKQTEILLQAVPIAVTPEQVIEWTGLQPFGIDYSQHGLQVCRDVHKALYGARREANGTVKGIRAEVDAISVPAGFDPEPYRSVTLKEKYDALKAAQEHNKALEEMKRDIADAERSLSGIDAAVADDVDRINLEAGYEVKAIEEKIAALQAKLAEVNTRRDDDIRAVREDGADRAHSLREYRDGLTQTLNAAPEPIDTAPLEKEVEEYEAKKLLVNQFDQREGAKARLEAAKTEADKLDTAVKVMAAKPQELVAAADLPIKGLGIDEDGHVTIDERPLKSLSTSEQIRISLEIARVTAGPLKLVCIDGLEALDKETREELFQQIEADDYQYFLTEVGSGELAFGSWSPTKK